MQESLSASMGAAVEKVVGAAVEKAVGAAVEKAVGAAVEKAVGAAEKAVGPAVEKAVGPAVKEAMGPLSANNDDVRQLIGAMAEVILGSLIEKVVGLQGHRTDLEDGASLVAAAQLASPLGRRDPTQLASPLGRRDPTQLASPLGRRDPTQLAAEVEALVTWLLEGHRGFWALLEWELDVQVRLLEGVPLDKNDATLPTTLKAALKRVRAIQKQQRPGQQGDSTAALRQPVLPQASEPSDADMDALVALAGRARRARSSAGQGRQRGRGGGAGGAAAGERDDGDGKGSGAVYGMLTRYATTPGARRALLAGGLCVPALVSLQPHARAWGSFPPEQLQVDWLAGAASAAEAELWLAEIKSTGTQANLQQARKQLERAATVLLCVRNVIRRHHESAGPRAAVLNLLNLIPASLLGRSSSSPPPPPALSITGIAGWVTDGDANPPRPLKLVPACGAPVAMHFGQVSAAGGGRLSRRGRG